MTSQLDAATGRDIVARWLALAEKRLAYLSVMFETGRWRRYYSEREFLENIQESKAGVEAWRALLSRTGRRDNKAVDLSWLDRRRTTLPSRELWRDPVDLARPAEIARELGIQASFPRDEEAADAGEVAAVLASAEKAAQPVPRLTAITQRYPLLHNAL